MLPRINDITTTPDAPPMFLTRTAIYPPHFAAQQRRAYPDLAPLVVKAPVEKCLEAAKSLILSMENCRLVSTDPKRQALEAVAITPLLRFRDDVVIEIRREGIHSAIHLRSRSRLGKSDFGANAQRIRTMIAALKLSLTS